MHVFTYILTCSQNFKVGDDHSRQNGMFCVDLLNDHISKLISYSYIPKKFPMLYLNPLKTWYPKSHSPVLMWQWIRNNWIVASITLEAPFTFSIPDCHMYNLLHQICFCHMAPPVKSSHGKMITAPQFNSGMIIYPCHIFNVGLANSCQQKKGTLALKQFKPTKNINQIWQFISCLNW